MSWDKGVGRSSGTPCASRFICAGMSGSKEVDDSPRVQIQPWKQLFANSCKSAN